MLQHPAVAFRDCTDCKKWIYDHETGERITGRDGRPIARPPGTPLPCDFPNGCAKGRPDAGIELTPNNAQAYLHYLECKAVGRFPDDPIVRRNARLIRQIEDVTCPQQP